MIKKEDLWFDLNDSNQEIIVYLYRYDFSTEQIEIKELKCKIHKIYYNSDEEGIIEDITLKNDVRYLSVETILKEATTRYMMLSKNNNEETYNSFKEKLNKNFSEEIQEILDKIKEKQEELDWLKGIRNTLSVLKYNGDLK